MLIFDPTFIGIYKGFNSKDTYSEHFKIIILIDVTKFLSVKVAVIAYKINLKQKKIKPGIGFSNVFMHYPAYQTNDMITLS